jgi:origin recognition complex subunit 4
MSLNDDPNNGPDNSFGISLTDSASRQKSQKDEKDKAGDEVQSPRTRSKGTKGTEAQPKLPGSMTRGRRRQSACQNGAANQVASNSSPARANPNIRTRASTRFAPQASVPANNASKRPNSPPCAKRARNARDTPTVNAIEVAQAAPLQQSDMNTRTAAVLVARDWVINATMNPKSRESMDMQLRPSLLNAIDFIASNIENAAQLGGGANHSLLLMGGRGSGKTTAVERALCRVDRKLNMDGTKETTTPFMGVVRLYGNVHNEERVAFREIARQLCETFELQFVKTASLGENISFLNQILLTLKQAQKFLCFVLEDFDTFAQRNKQTLLYCLLDALQKSMVKASVIGTTTRHDCIDLLEKRVKSRFSHRTHLLHPPKLEKWRPAENDAGIDGQEVQCQGALEVLQDMLTLPEATFPDAQHAARHNKAVATAVQHSATLPALKKYVDARSNLHDLRNVALYIANHMGCKGPRRGLLMSADVPAEECISQACAALTVAIDCGIQSYISGLSIVELVMLAATYRATRKRNEEAINFEMAYQEFAIYCASGDHVDNYSKIGGFRAFERLIDLGLITYTSGIGILKVGEGQLRNHTPVHLQVRPSELLAGFGAHSMCPHRLKEWAVREGGPLVTVTNMLMA